MGTSNFEMVDTTIFNWFLSMRSQNVPLSAAMFHKKALKFDKELNVENFRASDGWLWRWKERDHTDCIGESKSVTTEIVGG